MNYFVGMKRTEAPLDRYFDTPNSARRFFAHADSLDDGSTGISAPKLTVWILLSDKPLEISELRTA